jgi:hypothetical protein
MGFTLALKGDNSALIRVENEQDLRPTFLVAIESCLKHRVMRIEVDLSLHSSALPQMIEAFLKLQDIVSKQGKSLILRVGNDAAADLVQRLVASGAEVHRPDLVSSAASFAGPTKDEIEASIWNIDFSRLLEHSKQGIWPDLENVFVQVREQLEKVLREEKALQSEIEIYRGRISELRQALPRGANFTQAVAQMTDAHDELAVHKNAVLDLKKRIAEAEESLRAAGLRYRGFSERLEVEMKIKVDALKKDLSEHEESFQKMTQEFAIASKARQERIAALQAERKK